MMRNSLLSTYAVKSASEVLVPRRSSNTPDSPRRKLIEWVRIPRSTSTSRRADSALTTEAPTPCRPPEAVYEPPPNLPPACSLVNTTSTPVRPVRGSRSTGMPRPLSRTSTDPSAISTTSMRSHAPARASSTELSMISHTQCMSPRESVEPMYMPGRLRTASRPSRTCRWRAMYWEARVLGALVSVPPPGWAVLLMRVAVATDVPSVQRKTGPGPTCELSCRLSPTADDGRQKLGVPLVAIARRAQRGMPLSTSRLNAHREAILVLDC